MSNKYQILSILSLVKKDHQTNYLSTYELLNKLYSKGVDQKSFIQIHGEISELLEMNLIKIVDVPENNSLQFEITPKGIMSLKIEKEKN